MFLANKKLIRLTKLLGLSSVAIASSIALVSYSVINQVSKNSITTKNITKHLDSSVSNPLTSTKSGFESNNNSVLEFNYAINKHPSSNELESDQTWIDSIKTSASSKSIKLFFTRNASLVFQQTFLALNYLLTSKEDKNIQTSKPDPNRDKNQSKNKNKKDRKNDYSYEIALNGITKNSASDVKTIQSNQQNLNAQANTNSTDLMEDEIALFIDDSVYEVKDRFDFSLFENRKQFLLITKNSDIPLDDQLSEEEDEIYEILPTEKILERTLAYYQKKYPNQYLSFDIWIPDLSVHATWSRGNGFFKLLPYINKIYVTSDGNAQTYRYASSHISWAKKITDDIDQLNKETLEKLKILKTYNILPSDKSQNKLVKYVSTLDDNYASHTNSLTEEEKNYLKEKRVEALETYKTHGINWFLRSNLFTTFHISRYTDSSYYEIDKEKMYPAYVFNYDYIDLANKLFNSSTTVEKDKTLCGTITSNSSNDNEKKRKQFISFYEDIFFISNRSLETFVYEGFSNYDPKKKNIIWIGDSLIRGREFVNANRVEEIQNTFLGLTKKYDPSEYNYFFKHHPFYTTQQQKELTDFISAKVENLKPIYFSNFAWELFLSWEKAHQLVDKQYVPFFSETSNNDPIPRTTLMGIQYTSSAIFSTYLFLRQNYNYSDVDAYKSINFKNFPVPGTFDIISRGYSSVYPYNIQLEINRKKIDEIYQPFLGIGYLTSFKNDKISTEQFGVLNNLDVTFTKTPKMYAFSDLSLIVSISVISLISLLAASGYFGYKYRLDKTNPKFKAKRPKSYK